MRKLFLLLLSVVLITACNSDDDGNNGEIIVEQNFSADVDAIIALPPGSDISFLVNFGQPAGQSAAEAETEVELNNTLEIGRPTGLQNDDIFVYNDIVFRDENGEIIPPTGLDGLIIDGKLEFVVPQVILDVLPNTTATVYYSANYTDFALKVIDAEDDIDTILKYDIECSIERGGQVFGPYFIDPKIRVKSRGTSSN